MAPNPEHTASDTTMVAPWFPPALYFEPGRPQPLIPRVSPTPSGYNLLLPYAWMAGLGFSFAGAQALWGSLYLNAQIAFLLANFLGQGVAAGAAGFLSDGLIGAAGGMTFAPLPQIFNVGFPVIFLSDTVRFGFLVGVLSSLSNTYLLGGVLGLISAQRRVLDLGAYQGPDASEVAAAHGIDIRRDGLRRIVLYHKSSKGMSIQGGGGLFYISALAQLETLRGRRMIYQTHTSTLRARALVCEKRGMKVRITHKLRALGWRQELLALPDPHVPETLKLGDVLTWSTSSTYTAGLLVGNPLGWVGVRGALDADVEITLSKPNAVFLDVVFNPTHIRNVSIFTFTALGPQWNFSRGEVFILRQAFRFDMRCAEARAAYQHTVAGQPPCGCEPLSDLPLCIGPRATSTWADVVRHENTLLPCGVERMYVHAMGLVKKHRQAGVYWTVIPRKILPQGWMNALGTHRLDGQQDQSMTDGHTVDRAVNCHQETYRELVWHGVKSVHILSQQHWRTQGHHPPYFYGLILQAHLKRSCVRGLSLNQDTIDVINQIFGTCYRYYRRPGCKHQREVSISRFLNLSEIQSLSNHACAYLRGTPAHTTDPIHQASVATGIVDHVIVEWLHQLACASGIYPRVCAIQLFIQKHGLAGLGVIHRLLFSPGALQITTSSSVYTHALSKANKLLLCYTQVPQDMHLPKVRRKHHQKLISCLYATAHALADADDDSLLPPPVYAALRYQLQNAQRALYSLFSSPAFNAQIGLNGGTS